MQDFTLSCYEQSFWISELLKLQRWGEEESLERRFKIDTGTGKQPVSYFSLFGTVIDILQKPDADFKLYTLDDGTGTMICKQFLLGEINNLDALEDWNWNDTSNASRTFGQSTTMCDTIFNNQSVQQEEKEAFDQARRRVLESLRWSIVNSFRSSEGIEVGDSVCVHGRLYTYFNVNQIHVNAIRLITVKEELLLMRRKLEDSKVRLETTNRFAASQVAPVSKLPDSGLDLNFEEDPENVNHTPRACKRVSGLMTFDNVVESEIALVRVATENISNIALPPSPRPAPGLLCSKPVVSEIPPPFDTYFVEEISGSSSDEGDLFIPPTPQAKRPKIV